MFGLGNMGNNCNKMEKPKLKLTYFNGRGRGELARLILAHGCREFEDCRIEQSDWPAMKPNTPCGGLPVLCINGTEIAQSVAVARYCARECQIDGKTNLEKAQADMIVDCVTDCFLAFIPELFGKENTFKTEALPNFFKLMNKFLKANGGKYFVGKELTWADIAVANICDGLATKYGDSIFGEYQCLKDHHCHVFSCPGIKKYVEKRPKTPF